MEKRKFNAYGHSEYSLQSGKEIKAGRNIYCIKENIQEDLELALNTNIEEELSKLQEEELRISKELIKKLDDWQEVAEKVHIMQLAKKYNDDCQNVLDLETTNNEWVESKEWGNDIFRISNKSYSMLIKVYENTKYKDGKHIPYEWEVSYWLKTNGGSDYNTCNVVAAIDRKKFKDKDAAYKYIEGRKKFFSGYFKELYQPIRSEDIQYFKSCGKLLKGYTIKK